MNSTQEMPRGTQHVVRECLEQLNLPNAFNVKTNLAKGSYRVTSREVKIHGMISRERATVAMRELRRHLGDRIGIHFECQGGV